MKTKTRYSIIFSCLSLFLLFYYSNHRIKTAYSNETQPQFEKENDGLLLEDQALLENLLDLRKFLETESGQELPVNKPTGAIFKQFKSSFSSNSNVNPSSYSKPYSSRKSSTSNKNSKLKKPPEKCNFQTCFDHQRCSRFTDLKIYIYPQALQEMSNMNESKLSLYQKMLTVIQKSNYYTDNYNDACLFIIPYNTLVRDPLDDDFIYNLDNLIKNNLSHWNITGYPGRNHVIFNLYAGTWPNYLENHLGFDLGQAILAKASFSEEFYRPGFDISLPLFKQEQTQFKGTENIYSVNENVKIKKTRSETLKIPLNYPKFETKELNLQPIFPALRKYFLTFKGKRYLTGIGSETRNLLYHLHAPKNNIIMLTTCKHGNDWQKFADFRCDIDNYRYDFYAESAPGSVQPGPALAIARATAHPAKFSSPG